MLATKRRKHRRVLISHKSKNAAHSLSLSIDGENGEVVTI